MRKILTPLNPYNFLFHIFFCYMFNKAWNIYILCYLTFSIKIIKIPRCLPYFVKTDFWSNCNGSWQSHSLLSKVRGCGFDHHTSDTVKTDFRKLYFPVAMKVILRILIWFSRIWIMHLKGLCGPHPSCS